MRSTNDVKVLPSVTIHLSGNERSIIIDQARDKANHYPTQQSGCPLCRLLFLIESTEDREA